jgi:DNA-binding protein H-NS
MTAQAPSPSPVRTNGHPVPPRPVDPVSPPPGLPDLTALSDEVLAALVAQGQAEQARRHQQKETEFLQLVASTARTLGLSPARVAAAIAHKTPRPRPAGGGDGRSLVRPKYKNPNGPETWSGRGAPPPKWFSDSLAAGITQEAMRIPDRG